MRSSNGNVTSPDRPSIQTSVVICTRVRLGDWQKLATRDETKRDFLNKDIIELIFLYQKQWRGALADRISSEEVEEPTARYKTRAEEWLLDRKLGV